MLARLRDWERLLACFFVPLSSADDELLLTTASPFRAPSATFSSILFFAGAERDLELVPGVATSVDGLP